MRPTSDAVDKWRQKLQFVAGKNKPNVAAAWLAFCQSSFAVPKWTQGSQWQSVKVKVFANHVDVCSKEIKLPTEEFGTCRDSLI